jgi:predicted Zn finger-like uncharacterized protein
MIITCPACDAQYLLPDESIPANGRRVKCTTCAHIWTEYPETPPESVISDIEEYDPVLATFSDHMEEEPAAVVQTPHEEFLRQSYVAEAYPTIAVERNSTLKNLLQVLVITAILIAATIIIALILRPHIVKRWPPSALFYETIGLPQEAPGKGLAIEDIALNTTPAEDNSLVLSVKGSIRNTTSETLFLPDLLVRMNGTAGLLKEWPIQLDNRALQAGKSVSFEYFLKGAPADGQSITVVFHQ